MHWNNKRMSENGAILIKSNSKGHEDSGSKKLKKKKGGKRLLLEARQIQNQNHIQNHIQNNIQNNIQNQNNVQNQNHHIQKKKKKKKKCQRSEGDKSWWVWDWLDNEKYRSHSKFFQTEKPLTLPLLSDSGAEQSGGESAFPKTSFPKDEYDEEEEEEASSRDGETVFLGIDISVYSNRTPVRILRSMDTSMTSFTENTQLSHRSSARWSVSHPVKDDPPKKYRTKRIFRRFIPGQRKTTDVESSDEHIVHVNDPEATSHFEKNKFITSRYTIWNFAFKNLWEQLRRVANSYFVLITIFQLVPGVSPFPLYITALPLAFILGVTAVKEGYEDYLRHVSDNKVNSAKVTVIDHETGTPKEIRSDQVRIGDIIAVDRDHVCAADIVVLSCEHHGTNENSPRGFVDTANLDGETRLKVRRAVPLTGFIDGLGTDSNGEQELQPNAEQLNSLQAVITADKPNPFIEVFSGRMDSLDDSEDHAVQLSRENMILRGAVLRNTIRAWGVVVGAGPTTKLRQNQQLPIFKFSRVERALNVCLAVVFIYQTLLCVTFASLETFFAGIMQVVRINPEEKDWPAYGWTYPGTDSAAAAWVFSFLTFFILLSFMIPMSMYIVLEMGKLAGGLFIHWDQSMYSRDGLNRPAKPNTTSLVEELGMVEYVLSDKTGTLTDNEMRFTHCSTKSGAMYEADFGEDFDENTVPVLRKLTKKKKNGNSKRGSIALPAKSVSDPDLKKLMLIMATCNELEVEKDEDGSPLEGPPQYSGESPDEVALASTARDFGTIVTDRSPTLVTVRFANNSVSKTYQIHALLPFNSNRKRMGVVISEQGSSKGQILYKGADNIMLELFDGRHNVSNIEDQVSEFSNLGLRTLVMGAASIDLDGSVYSDFKIAYESAQLAMEDRDGKVGEAFLGLEKLLEPVGCTGVEDKLSEGVEDALQSLVKASVQVAVLTGDKTETAFSICKSCGLFKPGSRYHQVVNPDEQAISLIFDAELASSGNQSPKRRHSQQVDVDDELDNSDTSTSDMEAQSSLSDDQALIISGECLRVCLENPVLTEKLVEVMKRCYTTVCTRMTPKQKAKVTKLVREKFGVVTLSIGDGANDVSMIREADVGVGVFGKEGSQAVNSADFAIHKFADLKSLLFVHGATSKLRIVTAARASLFANMAFNMPQVLFNIFAAYSGVSIEVTNILTFINIVITAPFLLAIACFDRKLLPEDLREHPEFYDPHGSAFALKEFLLEMLLAFWQAGVALAFAFIFGGVWRSDGLVAGMWAEGTLLCAILIQSIILNLSFRINAYTAIHAWCIFQGFFAFYFILFGLAELWSPETTDNGYIITGYVGESISFWLIVLLGVFTSFLPYYVVKAYYQLFSPSKAQIFIEKRRAAIKML